MAKVGDTVEVTIKGGRPNHQFGPTSSSTDLGGMVLIRGGETMTVPGRIVEDYGNQWLVELDITISGKNRMLIPKVAQR